MSKDRITVIDELDTAFAQMLARQQAQKRRGFRSRRVALTAGIAVLLFGSAAGAAGIAGVWKTDEPADGPPDGRFELKFEHEGSTYALLVWRPDGHQLCYEAGPESEFASYPLADGGSCFDTGRVFAEKGFTAGRSQRGEVVFVSGIPGPRVTRVLVAQGGDERELELSDRSRAFMAVVSSDPVEVVAEFNDSRRDSLSYPAVREPVPDPAPPSTPITEGPRIEREAAIVPKTGDQGTQFLLVVRKPERPAIYQAAVTGPGGSECSRRVRQTFGLGPTAWQFPTETGYVARPLSPPTSQPNGTSHPTDPWCPGSYRLELLLTSPDAPTKRLETTVFKVG